MIGPPMAKLLSQFLRSAGASPKLSDLRWSSILLDWPHCPAKLPKYSPVHQLPPVFGMMLNAGPPRSASPRPPEMLTCTSAELFMSYRYPETPPPLLGAPTFIPSIWMAPSLARPPRAVKKLLLVVTRVLNLVACTAGIAAR